MEITTYLLSNVDNVHVNRVHFCTWDLKGSNFLIELGVDFSVNDRDDVEFLFSAPFIDKKCKIVDLLDAFQDRENIKFIFNDQVSDIKPINASTSKESVVYFTDGYPMRFLSISSSTISNNLLSIRIANLRKGDSSAKNNYFRFYLVLDNKSTIPTIQTNVSQIMHIYDFRLNERRNIPNLLYSKLANGYHLCEDIDKCYVMHALRSTYSIIHSEACFRSLRLVENEKFYAYICSNKKMKPGEYIISFSKMDTDKGACSTCIEFGKDYFGSKQVFIVLCLNVFSNLLFYLYSGLKEHCLITMSISNVLFWVSILIGLSLSIFLIWKGCRKM